MASLRVRLGVEQLGDRVLPSTTATLPTLSTVPLTQVPTNFIYGSIQTTASNPADGAVFPASPGPTPPPAIPPLQLHALAGSVLGTFAAAAQSGGGYTYQLRGTSWLEGLGSVSVTGTLHSVGKVSSGAATGLVTFSNSKGSVTIKLTGTTQPGNAPLPEWFTYSTVAGTGAYKNLHDSGTLWLGLSQNPGSAVPASKGEFFLNLL